MPKYTIICFNGQAREFQTETLHNIKRSNIFIHLYCNKALLFIFMLHIISLGSTHIKKPEATNGRLYMLPELSTSYGTF